jgi:1,4-alpha-glucan branching enzyme
MLYLDYSRKPGEWLPNRQGGRENLDAIELLQQLNVAVGHYYPGALTIAEESTAFPAVTQPVHLGGLGFHFKWNMGWMNDTLRYAALDPIHRRFHHHLITFSFVYAWSEKFLLPLSHDEVVHGKRSLLEKMPGDRWQRFANYRWLRAYMTAHPGKKLLFMGQEFGQSREWNHAHSLEWHERDMDGHRGLVDLNRELNMLYAREPGLHVSDPEPQGFRWIDHDNAEQSVFAFLRRDPATPDAPPLICVFNATPVPRGGYRIGVERPGSYRAVLDTDAARFGGSGYSTRMQWTAGAEPWHGFPHSLQLDLPPLAAVFLSAAP